MQKKIITKLTSENDLYDTLSALIDEIENQNLFQKLKRGESLELIFGEEIDGSFVPFQVNSTPIPSYYDNHDVLFLKDDSDAAFFEACCSYQSTLMLVIKLLNLIIENNNEVGEYDVPYRDVEQVFGLIPAAALIRTNSVYCRFYGELLKTVDMDHACYEYAILLHAFEKHGCCIETMSLLATCLFPAAGQNANEDFEYLIENYPINDFLQDQLNYTIILNVMCAEFSLIETGHMKFYTDYYIDEELFEDGANENIYKLLKQIEETFKGALEEQE